jgi:hypothetical protein
MLLLEIEKGFHLSQSCCYWLERRSRWNTSDSDISGKEEKSGTRGDAQFSTLHG